MSFLEYLAALATILGLFVAIRAATRAVRQSTEAYKQSERTFDLNLYLPVVAKNNSDLFNVLNAENDVKVALSLLHLSNDKSLKVREQYLNELGSAMHKVRDALRMHENSYNELSLILNNCNIDEETKQTFNSYLYAMPSKIQKDVVDKLKDDFKKVIPNYTKVIPGLELDGIGQAIVEQPDLELAKIKQNESVKFEEHNFEYAKSRHTCTGALAMNTAQHFLNRIKDQAQKKPT
ncbi:hypothetical protein [Photobacterium leiognathi]|uniref:hypothetical protein n=1 Tax=Photobacterium leiognathi TaxID=553611 RepID=UPI002981EB4E|nr:hypothetical protein [Photobacterium leiognathi]